MNISPGLYTLRGGGTARVLRQVGALGENRSNHVFWVGEAGLSWCACCGHYSPVAEGPLDLMERLPEEMGQTSEGAPRGEAQPAP